MPPRKSKKVIEMAKLRTLKATMHTVEDTIGNALVSMKSILMEAKKKRNVSDETFSRLSCIISDSMKQMREIGDIDVVNVKHFTQNIYYLEIMKDQMQKVD